MREHPESDLILRLASPTDGTALRTLAELDSARVPDGELLIAEVDGRVRAAMSLARGEVIADPFHRTAHLVALLRVRAAEFAARDARAATSLSPLERGSAHIRSAKPLAALRRLA